MQITELKKNGLEREFKIKIPSNNVVEKLNSNLSEISKDVEIEGFRKGKAPLDIIKQRYGDNALRKTLDELIQTSSNEVIQKKNLKLAIKPKVDVKNFGEEKGLEYIMTIELIPEFKVEDLKTIKLVKFVSKVNEEDYKKTLDTFASTQQNFEKKDEKKIENRDGVLLNLKPTFNNEIVKEAQIENKMTIIGNKMIMPEIEKNLLGKKAGDKLDFICKFPKNFPNKNIAEKDVRVEIDILEVRVAKKKVLDDTFAKTMGATDLNDFKDKVKKQMQGELDNVSKMVMKKDLIEKLDKMHKINLPQGLVNYEFENIWKKFNEDKSKGIIDETDKNKKDEDIKKEYKSIAERRVKVGLILAKIGEEKKINVNEEDLKKAIEEEILRQPNAKDQIIKFYTENSQALASLKAPIFEQKVVDYMLENIKVDEKEISRKDLLKK
ncbi:MAG: Trigger factor [Alphaproteobacteria bacterium MarineAlpha6_Bin6]|nr:MAG: Trigger factor [Alphaproteobacteria bacterium MarineAlpha6_Bin6]PPR32540.1 MAG: Trigger factor [Alphaproteobacteria bacterium MarineAlpha6_Bin5]|tara:strand:- start:1352 stop:2662 length:1311 start_codon:yes stop_codon:yes gene_type:complete